MPSIGSICLEALTSLCFLYRVKMDSDIKGRHVGRSKMSVMGIGRRCDIDAPITNTLLFIHHRGGAYQGGLLRLELRG
jgi:hypothetical protein